MTKENEIKEEKTFNKPYPAPPKALLNFGQPQNHLIEDLNRIQ